MIEVTTVAEDSMDLVDLLRKRGEEPDADFLWGAVVVPACGIMEAEVTENTGASGAAQ